MPARRTLALGPDSGWSAIALHLESAEAPKEGFYLTLFPDGKPPAVVFLRGAQVGQLVDMASQSAVTDQTLWDFVARIPLEPLLPNRSLASKLRALLVDAATAIREQVRSQHDRQAPLPPAEPLDADPAPRHDDHQHDPYDPHS